MTRLTTPRPCLGTAYDFIIVGAGSSGCVLANRLSSDPGVNVLLLEAGGGDAHPMLAMPLAWLTAAQTPEFGWGYETEPETFASNRAVPQPRGKLLGGTSSINGMMYSRGNAGDYDRWAAMGLHGWSHAEVLPYFRRSESNWRGKSEHHGASGPLTVSCHPTHPRIFPRMIETAARLGYGRLHDFNAAETEGFGIPDFTIHGGNRGSSSAAYLRPATNRRNLTIETDALTSRVMIEGGRAVGVEYVKDGQRRQVRAEREVVLSAGAFNSPQILLLSGIGPADELRALGIDPILDLPGVGRNLQDHPMVGAIYRAAGRFTFDRELRLDRLLLSTLRWRLNRTGPVAGMPFSVQGFLRTRPELEYPDAQFQVSHVSLRARAWFPGWRLGAGHEFTVGSLLLRPESRGSVTLRSADPSVAPRIRFNLLEAEADRVALRKMVRFTREFFATAPASSLVKAELAPGPAVRSDAEIDAYMRDTVVTGMHPTSSCAMGIGPDAVVDAALKLYGIDGLRVVDASVMPDVPSGNTNAPAIMIAERAADLLLGRAPLPGVTARQETMSERVDA